MREDEAVTEHQLRRKWLPADEAALLTAYSAGLLEERSWCDLKAALGSGPKANAETARDLASFSVDAGTLIIGLDEKEPDGSPLTPVDLSEVTPERIEQIAAMKIDPPLNVECSVVPTATGDGRGYVLVHVPASPLSPHQVEGKYLGRGDKTKRYLSDAKVTRLMQRRERWNTDLARELDAYVAADPYPDSRYPHLFMLAQPITHDTELCRGLIEGAGGAASARELLNAVVTGSRIQHLFADCYDAQLGARPLIADLVEASRTAEGLMLQVQGMGQVDPGPNWESYARRMELREDGGIHFYAAHMGEPDRAGVNGVTYTGLFLDRTLSTVREILEVASEVSQRVGFAGAWHLGVAVTGIAGAGPISSQTNSFYSSPGLNRYTKDSYHRTAQATLTEIIRNPGRVAERLAGLLHRSMSTGPAPAFIDPPVTVVSAT